MGLAKQIVIAAKNFSEKQEFDGTRPAFLSFVRDLPSEIKNLVGSMGLTRGAVKVEGSAGKGNWTDNPWVAIFDTRVTSKASFGYYVVLLFSKDQKKLALALANSVSDDSRSISIEDVNQSSISAEWVRGQLKPGYLNESPSSNGGKYERAVVLFKTYDLDAIEKSSIEADLKELLGIYLGFYDLKKNSSARYWAAGAKWADEDKSNEFIESGTWRNGYAADSGDISIETVKRVAVGDFIALKSSFAKGGEGALRVKAVGKVTRNPGDGINLEVDWHFKGPAFDIIGTAYRTTIVEVKNEEVRKLIFDNGFKAVSIAKGQVNEFPVANVPLSSRNVILVGPPGVGKTYQLLKLQEYFSSAATDESDLSAWIADLKWWEVVAVALSDFGGRAQVTDLMNHEYIKVKIKQSSAKHPRQTIWSVLQGHTVADSKLVEWKGKSEPLIFDKKDDSTWIIAGNHSSVVELINSRKSKSDQEVTKRFEFVTFHQSYSYEDFVEGIRPVIDEEADSLRYELSKGVFKRICERALSDPQNSYAIFIDELNRGNVSKIFGELITLIENDKRIGEENEVLLTLPYSKKEFGVPSNLYIIATMNSADRSTAVLDLALRRRFSFTTLMPDMSLIPEKIGGVPLRSIMEEINRRVSALVGPELQIGHGFFLSEECGNIDALNAVWCTKIVPQIQEYFFDDPAKLQYVLGPWLNRIDLQAGDSELSMPASFITVLRPDDGNEFKAHMLKLDEYLRAS